MGKHPRGERPRRQLSGAEEGAGVAFREGCRLPRLSSARSGGFQEPDQMRIPSHFGRLLALLALVVASCTGGLSAQGLTASHGRHGHHFPAHRPNRPSARGRRSQHWDAHEEHALDETHARPSARLVPASHATGKHPAADGPGRALALPRPQAQPRPLAMAAQPSRASASRGCCFSRGPPAS